MDFLGNHTGAGLENGGEINGDLDINGDLSVSGTGTFETIIAVDEIKVSDAIILMGHENPADLLNLGILEEHYNSGERYSGLIRASADKKQYLIESVTPIPTAASSGIDALARGDLLVNEITAATVHVGTAYTLPSVDGNSGESLTSNGAGVLSFQPAGNPFDQNLNSNNFPEFGGVTYGSGTLDYNVATDGAVFVIGNDDDLSTFSVDGIGQCIRRYAEDEARGSQDIHQKSRGTIASPTQTLSGDSIISTYGDSYTGSLFKSCYHHDIVATELHSPGNVGVALEISTTDDGTDVPTQKMRMSSDGLEIGPPISSYVLPWDRGDAGDILVSNASGGISWAAPEVVQQITQSTGVLTGGQLSINAGDDELFDIADGSGIYVDTTTGISTVTSWAGLTAQSLAKSGGLTYVFMEPPSNTVSGSTTAPAAETVRDNIFLGVLGHANNVNITSTLSEPIYLANSTSQIFDLAKAIGQINTSGNTVGPSTLLTLAKSSGTIFSWGSNYSVSLKNPHNGIIAAIDTNVSDVFTYVYQDGSFTVGHTDLIPADYDDGNGAGTPGTVGNNDWSSTRVFLFSGTLTLMPGQVVYNLLAEAQAALFTESFVIAPQVANLGLLIGYIITRGAATDLNFSGSAMFIAPQSIFGGGSSPNNGTVVGPISSTVNGLCKFDSTSGQSIKDNSGAILTDAGLLTVPDLTVSNDLILEGTLDWNLTTSNSNFLIISNSADNSRFIFDEQGQTIHTYSESVARGSQTIHQKSRGDISTPLGTLSADSILTINGDSMTSSGLYNTCYVMDVVETENHTSGNTGVAVEISTVDDASATPTLKLRLATAGLEIGPAAAKYTLPWTRGNDNDVLVSDGSGNVSWDNDVTHNSTTYTGTQDWTIGAVGNDLIISDSNDDNETKLSSDGLTYMSLAGGAGGVGFRMQHSRGTLTTPTALFNGDAIGEFQTWGYDGSNYINGARIHSKTTEAWSPGSNGTWLRFQTIDDGNSSLSLKLQLDTLGVRLNDAYYLPTGTGTDGFVLKTDGAGQS